MLQKTKSQLGSFEMVAKTMHGFEEILAAEMEQLGAKEIKPVKRAVEFRGNNELLYKANLHSRVSLRILKPLAGFQANNERKLYQEIQKIDWTEILDIDQTFAIDSAVHSDHFNHSQYVSLKVKDAIVDQFRDKFGARPSVELKEPDVRINIRIYQDDCTVSLDSSGRSLHKRGYKTEQAAAPLNEITAAGLILLSGWNGDTDFIDPMCGSGTLVAEAALIAANNAPGLFNPSFAFQNWPDFDRGLWNKVLEEAEAFKTEPQCQFYASDISARNVQVTQRNLKRAGLDNSVNFRTGDFFELPVETETGTLLMNPPYGERLPVEEIENFYQKIGDQLKGSYTGHSAWILSSDLAALKFVGLRTSRKITVFNGQLECRFCNYQLYEGSRKKK